MPPLRTAPEIARTLADALDAAGLPYAVGGALALAYYAPPRATVDVDLNVFVPPADALARVLEVLSGAGFEADADRATIRAHACRDGQFRGRVAGMRVDVFVPAIEFYARLADRRREVTLMDRPLWIVGPEDLVVLKLMFYRRKDLADVEAVLAEQGSKLDRAYVHRTLAGLVGSDDERLGALRAIERDVDARP